MNQPAAIQKKPTDFLKSDWFVMICIYIGTFLLHTLMAQCATIFNLTPDEYSVTAIAAYVNGYNWSSTVSLSGYYGYLQGLLYAPVFNLTSDPLTRYDLMLAVNSFIVSFIPVIAYYLSRKAFSLKKFTSLMFSLICGLYPCYMLLTKYTWNESLCDIMPWLFLLAAYSAMDKQDGAKKQIISALGGVILVAGYAAHGRMLALIFGGIAIMLIAFFAMKKKIFCFIGFFGGVAASFVADLMLKNHFQNALWLLDQSDKAPTNTIENTLNRIFSADGEFFGNFFKALVGHFFYFISSTWGLGAISIALIIGAVFMYFRRRSQSAKTADGAETEPYLCDKDAILAIFTLLAVAAVFAISVIFKCTSQHLDARCDTLIYGRYTDVFAPLAIFTTLILLKRKKLTIYHSLAAVCTAGVVNTLTMLTVVPAVVKGTRMTSAMIIGLAPLRYGEKMKSLPTETSFFKIIATTMSVLMIFLIIQLVLRKGKDMLRVFSIPLASALLYTNLYCYFNYNVVQGKNALVGATQMSEALEMVQGSGLETVCCYDLALERYIKGQFLMPDGKVIVAKNMTALGKLEEMPHFIIADREDNLQMWVEGAQLVGDINNHMQLYACTDEAKEWAASQGYSLSENGSICYSGGDIPASKTATRENDILTCPNGAQVYTNYLTLYKKATYRITVTGDGVDLGNTLVTVTSDKGGCTHDVTVKKDNGVLEIQLEVTEKLEGVRIEIANSNTRPITITGLEIVRRNNASMYEIAQGALA